MEEGEVRFRAKMPVWYDDPNGKPGAVTGKIPSIAGTIVSVNSDKGTALVSFMNPNRSTREILIPMDRLRQRHY